MGLNGEGKPVFMPMEENYKEAVKWMRQLWEEGVVDPEYFTGWLRMKTAKQQGRWMFSGRFYLDGLMLRRTERKSV